ncbi:glycosyltransferase BC10 isoform X2 [Mangifera indica]|uniref:glycosyltransferase BC10 isoform X2 n=1 Tax=Mangifera indica TaxID=29780 RepID=UPI001CFA9FBF|nr:glycosyltransferase BC10 isoform X2 [Mangifera indica]
MSGSRQQRAQSKRPIWIFFFVSLVILFLIGAYVVFPSRSFATCYFFSSKDCTMLVQPLSPPARELTDDENMAWVVINELLKKPPVQSKNPKIAFMFLTPGALPFEKLWEMFFQVAWGKISMLDAERRLLAHALRDPDNQQFLLLSDSCVPLHNFDYVYNYLMYTNVSYIDCFEDPGPHGNGRYSERMLPEVEKKDFRKGAQWFSMKRQHAIIVMADNLFYTKFKLYCKPNMDGRNCYTDEHYLPTLFHMFDPSGIANWSVTHVDWSEGKWHPKAYRTQDVTFELLKRIASIDESVHLTSNEKKKKTVQPCLWNGMKRPCYLFARKFYPETLDRLLYLFSNYTTV